MKSIHSIRYKLLLAMLPTFLVCLLAVLSFWYYTLGLDAKDTAIGNMKTMLNVSNTTFENQLKDIINVTMLSTVSSGNYSSSNIVDILSNKDLTSSERLSYERETLNFITSLCSFKKHLKGLTLSNFSGSVVTYGNTTPHKQLENSGVLTRLKESDEKILFLKPHFPNGWYHTKTDYVFSVVCPIFNLTHKKIGYAIADINCQLFDESYDVTSEKNCSLYIVDDKRKETVYHTSKDILSLNNDLYKRLKGDSGQFITKSNDQNVIVVYKRSSVTGWTLISVIPESRIAPSFTSSVKRTIIFTLIILLVLVILLFFISSLLTKNISILTESVKQIDEENLEFTGNIKSKDEVGMLAAQFQAMLDRIRQLMINIKEAEAKKRSAELNALQFQMNPHFLYNSLNTIKFLASIQGIDNIKQVSESLSYLMHTNMDGRTFISIAEDIDFLECYFSIQNYRQSSLYDYEIIADESLYDYQIPKLFTQPLVENALKHGLKQKQTGGKITIHYEICQIGLLVSVTDNGCGIAKETVERLMSVSLHKGGGHIGICNIRERIELYFGTAYGLTITSIPDESTTFTINIPILLKTEVSDHEKNIIS